MFKLINNFFKIFSIKEKKFFILFILVLILLSIIELVAIGSVAPFIAIISDNNFLEKNYLLKDVYDFLNFSDRSNFTIFLASIFVFSIFLSSVAGTVNNLILIKFSSNFGEKLTNRFFYHYLNKNWHSFKDINSSLVLSRINSDITTIVSQILLPLLILSSRITVLFFVILFLFTLNPLVIILISLFLTIFYSFFFLIIKNKLIKNGNKISASQETRNLIVNESIVGIKEVILFSAQKYFFDKFKIENKIVYKKTASTTLLSQLPRGIIEVLSIIIFVLLVIIFFQYLKLDFISTLPSMAVYAIAGVKIIPSVQAIFQYISLIKSATPSFYKLYDQIKDINNNISTDCEFQIENKNKKFYFNKDIVIENVDFFYRDKKNIGLKKINLKIYKNQYVAIVGANGAGKSTLVDIILGLLSPHSGQILIDNIHLTHKNVSLWQRNIGYVPQKFFLFNDTIFKNLTIGTKNTNFSKERLDEIIKMTDLKKVIEKLPNGLDTIVNNNGINFSGGEKQKIVIARSLMLDPDILIFDEATSALDPSSENIINDIIEKLKGKKTIITITHKISSIKNCDNIFYLKDGKIAIAGKYDELVKNLEFQNFSQL